MYIVSTFGRYCTRYVCDDVHTSLEELIVGIGWFYALLMDFLIGT